MKQLAAKTIIFAAALAVLAAGGVQAQGTQVIDVTITNLTAGQVISPPVVISHNRDFQLFANGAAASPGLAALAQDGETALLVDEIAGDPSVFDIAVAPAGLPPGGSVTVQVEIQGNFRLLSTAGMLVTTNDSFFAARGLHIDVARVSSTVTPAYDAGAEEDNEDCDYIPGPPCGNPGVGTATSEGFIHINSGIHGIGDLAPEVLDWRNPVAAVTAQPAP